MQFSGAATNPWLVYSALLVVCGCGLLSGVVLPAVIYLQERKSFRRMNVVKLWGYTFFWVASSLVLWAMTQLLRLIYSSSKIQIIAHRVCQEHAKQLHWLFFGECTVIGTEYLPKKNEKPVVFVANHQSMMDIGCFFHIDGDYAWVSKDSVFFVPGAGWLMKLAGYIPLKRKCKESIIQLFQLVKAKLKTNWSVVVFPQGTRSRQDILPFKEGAFKMAVESQVDIQPVTLIVPDDLWTSRSGTCQVIIHPRISGENIERLKDRSFQVITDAMKKSK